MVDKITSISEFPKQLVKYFRCKLLHEKESTWDGTYYYRGDTGSFVPNIKSRCKVCDKDDDDTPKDQKVAGA